MHRSHPRGECGVFLRTYTVLVLTACRCICFVFPCFLWSFQKLVTLTRRLLCYRYELWIISTWVLPKFEIYEASSQCLGGQWQCCTLWWQPLGWSCINGAEWTTGKWTNVAKIAHWIQIIEELCFRPSFSDTKPKVFKTRKSKLYLHYLKTSKQTPNQTNY